MLREIQEAAEGLSCYALLDALINRRFKGKTVVTASLRARSIVVLQMVSDIDPSTPIVFCHAGTLYPESVEYKEFIIERFGFTDVRQPQTGEFPTQPGDHDHVEWMKASYSGDQHHIKEALHLNKTLKDFDCWISAVYHVPSSTASRNRIDIEGKLIRVNPILDWSRETVNEFMRSHDLPFHKLAGHLPPAQDETNGEPAPSYAY